MFKTLPAVLTSALICCQCGVGYAAPRSVTLTVAGMTCSTCPIAVKKALSRIDGVTAVDVSFEKKEATVSYDDAKANTQVLVQGAQSAGFTATIKQ